MKKTQFLAGVFAISSLLAGSAGAAIVLAVDLDGGDTQGGTGVVETGFVDLGVPSAAGIGVTFSTAETGVNATIGASGATGYLAGRNGLGQDRGGDLSNLTHNDLHGDVVSTRDTRAMTIQLTGLTVGEIVTLTAWHNDPNGGNSGFATVGDPVTPSLVSGGSLIGASNGAHTNLSRPATATYSGPYTDADLAPSVISWTATSSTADLLLTSSGTGNFNPVSGFTVDSVPEPSSLALLGLGAACFLRRRC